MAHPLELLTTQYDHPERGAYITQTCLKILHSLFVHFGHNNLQQNYYHQKKVMPSLSLVFCQVVSYFEYEDLIHHWNYKLIILKPDELDCLLNFRV